MRNVRRLAAVYLMTIAATASVADVVLTRSDKLIEGTVTVSETAVIVTTANGPHVLPRNQVLLRVATKVDAYKALAKEAKKAPDQLRLAQWCLDNSMQPQAIEQCKNVLRLAPGHTGATALMEKATSLGVETFVAPPPAPPTRPHGLQADTIHNYHRAVLPILRSSCATSGCHDRHSTNGLTINRDILKRDREATLTSILDNIDRLDPVNSPLVRYAITPHGGSRGRPIDGRAATRQIEHLVRWVNQAAIEADDPDNMIAPLVVDEPLTPSATSYRPRHVVQTTEHKLFHGQLLNDEPLPETD